MGAADIHQERSQRYNMPAIGYLTMILFIEQGSGSWKKHFHQIGHFSNDVYPTEAGLQAETVHKPFAF